MTKVEFELEAEMLQEIGELADEMEVSKAEIVRNLLSYALEHAEEIHGEEGPAENLEDEEPEDDEEDEEI
jgi:hypothetical protein